MRTGDRPGSVFVGGRKASLLALGRLTEQYGS
ncbi:hypothetical protein CGRA01v4_06499 [Colletotrichum graminicola]|nr:hypothetical protein CGRA01v4_06499 [Colletotrichum graminicola]